VLNAVSPQLGRALGAAMAGLDADPGVQVAIVTGAGDRAFCAGADLKAMRGAGPSMGNGGRVITRALRFRPGKPLLAAVNGLAYGGGLELMLACDLAVCSQQALFALPEVKRGILASGGGLVRMPHVIGPRRALQMTLTGEPVDAATALSWGLVNSVVAAGSVLEHTMSLAQAIARNAPLAVAASKRVITEGARLAEDDAWTLNEAASVTSPWTGSAPAAAAVWAAASDLIMARTWWPAATSAGTSRRPMVPDAPVTSTQPTSGFGSGAGDRAALPGWGLYPAAGDGLHRVMGSGVPAARTHDGEPQASRVA
jgi:crotonobetainyl-CoA hydratase